MILELLIGITIGFGLGVLIMIVVSDYTEKQDELHNDFDEQIHESGFIDIPLQHMYHNYSQKNHNPEVKRGFLKRIQRFKARNRFYS